MPQPGRRINAVLQIAIQFFDLSLFASSFPVLLVPLENLLLERRDPVAVGFKGSGD